MLNNTEKTLIIETEGQNILLPPMDEYKGGDVLSITVSPYEVGQTVMYCSNEIKRDLYDGFITTIKNMYYNGDGNLMLLIDNATDIAVSVYASDCIKY